MLSRARSRAKKKNMEFNLEESDIVIPPICPVLGIPLIVGSGGKRGPGINSPSLDRVDNSKGYVKGNVRVVSNWVNVFKNEWTIELLEKVLEYMKSHSEVTNTRPKLTDIVDYDI